MQPTSSCPTCNSGTVVLIAKDDGSVGCQFCVPPEQPPPAVLPVIDEFTLRRIVREELTRLLVDHLPEIIASALDHREAFSRSGT